MQEKGLNYFFEKNIKIYKIESKRELFDLMNRFTLRIFFGDETIAWKATDSDHSTIKELLKKYNKDLSDYSGFLIEQNHIIVSLSSMGKYTLNDFLQKYFPNCKKERDKIGIIL